MSIGGWFVVIIVLWLAYRVLASVFGQQDSADRERWQPPPSV